MSVGPVNFPRNWAYFQKHPVKSRIFLRELGWSLPMSGGVNAAGPESVSAPRVSDIGAFSVLLGWTEPAQPNGVIVNYLVYSNDQFALNVR